MTKQDMPHDQGEERAETPYRVPLDKVKRKHTGDSDLDALWAMPISELQDILDDKEHPQHGKAEQVSREMMEPVIQMVQAQHAKIARPISEVLAGNAMSKIQGVAAEGFISPAAQDAIRGAAAAEGFISPAVRDAIRGAGAVEGRYGAVVRDAMRGVGYQDMLAKRLDEMFRPVTHGLAEQILKTNGSWRDKISSDSWLNKIAPTPSAVLAPERPQLVNPPRVIDFEARELPDASAAEVQLAAGTRLGEILEDQLKVLGNTFEVIQANAASGAEALEVSREALKETRANKFPAWIAAIAAVLALIAAIFFGIWG